MSSSSFFDSTYDDLFDQAEPLEDSGATCLCYRVRLYGQLHFIKRLKENLRTDPRYVAAMQKEFVAGYGLNHPNIVRYLAKGDDYVVMEYVDGERLSDFLVTHPDYFSSKSHTTRFLNQLLSAIDHLHQHGIVHLDLKPQNILITRIGQNVKLVDLGFCYTADFPNTMGHTDRYAAPEQHTKDLLPDERTDLFAVGRIIEQLPCARKYRKVIARCTEPEPQKRFQSAQEVLTAIQPPKHKWRILTAVGVTTAFVAIVFLLWPRTQPLVATSRSSDSIAATNTEAPSDEIPVKETPTAEVSALEVPMNEVPMTKVPTTEVPATSSPQAQSSPQPIVSPTPTVPVRQEGTASPTPTKKQMTVEELRKKLHSIIQPIYVSTLEPITTMPYKGNEQLYARTSEEFRQLLRDRLHPLGEELVAAGAIGQRTFYQEWTNIEMDFINSTYYRMMSNE